MNLQRRGRIVDALSLAYAHGKQDIDSLPGLIVAVVENEAWRDRIIPQTGEPKHFDTFAEFVEARPVEGLGAKLDVLKDLCSGDVRATAAIEQVTQHPVGNPNFGKPKAPEPESADPPEDPSPIGNNVPNREARPEGNTAAKALRRLRDQRPDLHAKVIEGELTPHGAAVEAGFRHRTISVPVDQPERIAAALRRHLTPEAWVELKRLVRSD